MSGPEGPAAPALEGYGASSRIRGALTQMPEGMAKVGTLLLEDPSLPLRLSITELAKRAGTSPATVTRFCRAIGYTGYPALRVGAAAEQGRSSAHETWDSDIGRAFHPGDTATEMMRTLVNAHTVALTSTSERLDPALVGRVADAHLTSPAPGEYLQPDDLSAKHAQLFVIDLLYLLAAQRDFSRTTSLLAASAAAVAPHRRPLRPATRPRTVPSSKETATA